MKGLFTARAFTFGCAALPWRRTGRTGVVAKGSFGFAALPLCNGFCEAVGFVLAGAVPLGCPAAALEAAAVDHAGAPAPGVPAA